MSRYFVHSVSTQVYHQLVQYYNTLASSDDMYKSVTLTSPVRIDLAQCLPNMVEQEAHSCTYSSKQNERDRVEHSHEWIHPFSCLSKYCEHPAGDERN